MWPFSKSYPEISLDQTYEKYDFVVVGGGTAGCVLANRLSADRSKTVLLVERGPSANTWASRVPLLSADFASDGSRTMKRMSTPQEQLTHQHIEHYSGNCLGGTSRINQMAYTRGLPAEYDAWAAAGRKGWGWEDMRPYFLKSEGEWHSKPLDKWYFRCFQETVDSCEKLNVPYIPDLNSPECTPFGCGRVYFTIDKNSRRNSTYHAFLSADLVRTRSGNLHVCPDISVRRLVMEQTSNGGHVVRGVELASTYRNQRKTVKVDREVVLSAGPFGSPQILLLSGVGPAEHLKAHDIPVMKDLPAVGANLQDHFGVSVAWHVPMSESLICLEARPWIFLIELVRYLIWGTGLLLGPVVQLFIFLHTHSLDDSGTPSGDKSSYTEPLPDVELIPMAYDSGVERPQKDHGVYSILSVLLCPKSHGSVRLTSSDPVAPLAVDPCYLRITTDYMPLRAAVKFSLRVVERMQKNGYDIKKWAQPESESDEALDSFIRTRCRTTYHYSSTCRMAPEYEETGRGAVDDELRVYGVSNLRVADTSIFPWIPATHLQAPAVAVAEKCADMMKTKAQNCLH